MVSCFQCLQCSYTYYIFLITEKKCWCGMFFLPTTIFLLKKMNVVVVYSYSTIAICMALPSACCRAYLRRLPSPFPSSAASHLPRVLVPWCLSHPNSPPSTLMSPALAPLHLHLGPSPNGFSLLWASDALLSATVLVPSSMHIYVEADFGKTLVPGTSCCKSQYAPNAPYPCSIFVLYLVHSRTVTCPMGNVCTNF